uniref:Uncharacterized protein n=1 Tax=Arundo donax TaxID=35708 RepID=A0A0A8ZKK9_ARUDO
MLLLLSSYLLLHYDLSLLATSIRCTQAKKQQSFA